MKTFWYKQELCNTGSMLSFLGDLSACAIIRSIRVAFTLSGGVVFLIWLKASFLLLEVPNIARSASVKFASGQPGILRVTSLCNIRCSLWEAVVETLETLLVSFPRMYFWGYLQSLAIVVNRHLWKS